MTLLADTDRQDSADLEAGDDDSRDTSENMVTFETEFKAEDYAASGPGRRYACYLYEVHFYFSFRTSSLTDPRRAVWYSVL